MAGQHEAWSARMLEPSRCAIAKRGALHEGENCRLRWFLARKFLHLLLGCTFAWLFWFQSESGGQWSLFMVAYGALGASLIWIDVTWRRRLPILANLSKTSELGSVGGLTWGVVGGAIAFLIGGASTAVPILVILGVGDASAAVVGRVVGRHRLIYNSGKTVEGTLAGLAASLIAGQLVDPGSRTIVLAVTFSLGESACGRYDDNIVTTALMTLVAVSARFSPG